MSARKIAMATGLWLVFGIMRVALALDPAPTSEDVLKGRGLTRDGSSYRLLAETECLAKLHEIQPVYEKLDEAHTQITNMMKVDSSVAELEIQRINALAELKELEAQFNGVQVFRNGYRRIERNKIRPMLEQMRTRQSSIVRELGLAKTQMATPKQKTALGKEFERRRVDFLDASAAVRPLFEKVMKEYTSLPQETAVREALKELRKATKVQVAIAPSENFKKASRQLRDAEKAAQAEKFSPATSTGPTSKKGATKKR